LMVAFAESHRPLRRAPAPPCVGSSSCATRLDQPLLRNDRNQQYSVIAITGGSASIQERYAYTAYGAPTILDASGTPRPATAEGNRYTYTGREWDEELNLYHYRARMFDPVAGRFLGRDPIGFSARSFSLYQYCHGKSLFALDPSGLEDWIPGPRGEEWCVEMSERDADIHQMFTTSSIKQTDFTIKVQFKPAPQDHKNDCCPAQMTRVTYAHSYPIVVSDNQEDAATVANGVPWSIYVDPLSQTPSIYPGADPPAAPGMNWPGVNGPYGPNSQPNDPPWIEVGGAIRIPENYFIRNPPRDRLYVFTAIGTDCNGAHFFLGSIVVRVTHQPDLANPPFSNVNIGIRPPTTQNETFNQCLSNATSNGISW